jgi:hypothetical protein
LRTYTAFSKTELKQFSAFVASPYFNTHKHVMQLHEFITTNLYQPEACTKPAAYKYVFGKGKPDEQQVSDLMTYLYRLTQKFFAVTNFLSDPASTQVHAANELRKRGMKKELKKTIDAAVEEPTQSSFILYKLFEEADLDFISSGARKPDDNLQKKSDNLDQFYFAEKLKNACEMINRNRIINAGYEAQFIEPVIEIVNGNGIFFSTNPATVIYKNIYSSLTDPENPEPFAELKKMLAQNATAINSAEAYNMYSYAQNYCIRKINNGNTDFLKELFTIYQTQIAQQRICTGETLSEWDFKNIVSVGCRLKEFDYCQKFIESWKDKLQPDVRENAYQFNMAHLLYEKKDLKSALRLLQSVQFTDIFYNLSARSIMMKAAYEEEDADLLDYCTDAFKAFILRNKNISTQQKQSHLNFIRLTKTLNKIRIAAVSMNKTTFQKERSALSDKVNNSKGVTNKPWLIAMVNQLM